MSTEKNLSAWLGFALLITSCTYSAKRVNSGETTKTLTYSKFEPVSKKNTDMDSIKNVKRPNKSQIIDPSFSIKTLFGIWVINPAGPVADFELDKNSFFVADYDGDGSMPYLLHKDSITVYYNDYIARGLIKKSTKDSLTISWDNGEPTNYVKWTQ
jgi:hypothetical protein